MMESLPESAQDRVIEQLRLYIEEVNEEIQWDSLVAKTQPKLVDAARKARRQISEGHSIPFDEGRL
jgi:hypothetical protein